MAFGRRKREPDLQESDLQDSDLQDSDLQESDQQESDQQVVDQQNVDRGEVAEVGEEAESAGAEGEVGVVVGSGLSGDADGPFDIEDFDDPAEATVARLDLGSVLIPMQPDGQVQVELNQMGVPSAIWMVTPNGRFTIAAYAAPKSPGLWREVAGELADALRNDSAAVSIEDGPWGREVVGTGAGVVRFIGVDGYRWMIRCVVNGMPQSIDQLAAEAREAMADTVVRRGETPLPVRTPLPVELPEPLAAQLNAAAVQQAQQSQQAQQAMFAAQQAMLAQQQQQRLPLDPQEPADQRGSAGSVTQQLRTTNTSTSTGG